jgi:hypothetical protein
MTMNTTTTTTISQAAFYARGEFDCLTPERFTSLETAQAAINAITKVTITEAGYCEHLYTFHFQDGSTLGHVSRRLVPCQTCWFYVRPYRGRFAVTWTQGNKPDPYLAGDLFKAIRCQPV